MNKKSAPPGHSRSTPNLSRLDKKTGFYCHINNRLLCVNLCRRPEVQSSRQLGLTAARPPARRKKIDESSVIWETAPVAGVESGSLRDNLRHESVGFKSMACKPQIRI
jgi:hypothetical protein